MGERSYKAAMKIKTQVVFALALVFFALPPLSAVAGDEPGDAQEVAREEIQQIKSEVHFLQQRLAELMARLEKVSSGSASSVNAAVVSTTPAQAYQLEPAVLTLPAASSVAADTTMGLTPDSLTRPSEQDQGLYGSDTNEPNRNAALGEKVQVGGYGSFRYEANSIAPAAQIANHPPALRSHDSFDFRRFVLTLDANPTDRLRFYTEIEFERLGEIGTAPASVSSRKLKDRTAVSLPWSRRGPSLTSTVCSQPAWV
jgi:hypothetical protein